MTQPVPLPFAYVVISVADMDRALGLWVERFGMQVIARREGSDPDMARAWGLPADGISDQVLLRTPGVREGGVHLVRFKLPGEVVRAGAAPSDHVLKSVDIAVRDIQARYDELTKAGYKFRSPVGKLQAQNLEFFEVHMFGHDDVNLVFIEIPAKPESTSDKGYGVAPQIVVTTPNNEREVAFLKDLLGLQLISHNVFSGPQIEKAVGLPPGATLDISIIGNADNHYGRIELVQYGGAKSANLFPRTVPPARGMLSVTYIVPQLDALLARGQSMGVKSHGAVSTVLGKGRMASVTTPTGMRLDFFQAD